MALVEYEAALGQREQREPESEPLPQLPPKSAELGALYSEPRPSVLAFHAALANGPPRSRPHTYSTPADCMTPHLDV